MADQPIHPMGVAMQWVARILAATIMMSLPGLGGLWLDQRWGTGFIGLAGFACGLVAGMMYLIAATRSADAERKRAARQRDDEKSPHSR